jgi:hypothetical protein
MKPKQNKTQDIRLSGPDVLRMLGRSPQAIVRRRATGDWVAPGPDREYSLAEIIGIIPALWDRLGALRKAAAKFAEHPGRASKTEAQRQLIIEKVCAAKRGNEIAAGRMVDMEEIRQSDERLFALLREHVAGIAQAVILKLALPAPAAKTVNEEVSAALKKVKEAMEK